MRLHTAEACEEWLRRHGIPVVVHRHPPVFTVEQAREHTHHLPGGHVKNLFLEDKKGEELVYVRAEKDMTQSTENDRCDWVGHDRITTVGNDETKYVEKGNRLNVVEMGNDTHQVKMGNRDVKIDMGNDTLTIKMGNETTKINLGKSETEAMQSIELKVGQSSVKVDQMGVTIKGMMIKIEGTIMTQVKAPMTQVNADAILTLKGGLTMIG